ncbi:hypothetical protein Hanom_Chr04g00319201 [Helianthus anomalus]
MLCNCMLNIIMMCVFTENNRRGVCLKWHRFERQLLAPIITARINNPLHVCI